MLTVYIDFKSIPSFLALQPTLRLIAEHPVSTRWLPFRTRERELPGSGARREPVLRHKQIRDAYYQRINRHHAALRGISLAQRGKEGQTDTALNALLGIEGNPLRFIEACYSAYWTHDADLNSMETVRELLGNSGVDYRGAGLDDFQQLDAHQAQAEATGVIDAPTFVVSDQIFWGREHLPWMKELLTQLTD